MFWQAHHRRQAEFGEGVRDQFSVAMGIAAWGMMTGVAMVKSGLSVLEALLMTLIVYAGSAQLAAIPMIASGAPLWVILAAAFCVNLRFVVFSAHLRPYLMHLPRWQRLATGYVTGDLSYVFFARRYPHPGQTPAELDRQQAYLMGNCAVNYLAWMAASVIGILLAKDLLSVIAQGVQEGFRLKEILRPAVFVPESKRLNVLLREFRASRNHLAIVIDEYGSPAGLVSIEDVIEQIVGEIDDEHDVADDDYIRPFRGNRYTVRARMPIGEFNEYFGTTLSDEECDTIGGLVIQQFGSQPGRGDTIEFGDFTFTVLRADKRRVHTLRVTRHLPPPAPDSGSAD